MNKVLRIHYGLRPRERTALAGRLTASFAAADAYAGAEPEYRALLDKTAKVEHFIRRRAAGNLSPAFEAAMTAQTGDAITISNILDRAAASYDAALRAGQAKGAVEIAVPFVLIPPDADQGGIVPGDGAQSFEPPVFMDRLNILRRHLNMLGIYEDDLIIQRGELAPGQMRQRPYVLIEIPKLDAQICVCDQVGEATFVKRGMMPVEHWASYTKTALENLPGGGAMARRDCGGVGGYGGGEEDECADGGSTTTHRAN